jgi:predicted amidohydrolase
VTGSRLVVATCQFPVSADVRANAGFIRDFIAEAARAGANITHFSECALSGYGGITMPNWHGYDWPLLRHETESIMATCRRHRIWAVVGSSHQLSPGRQPHNCVYVIDADGSLAGRYDKRRCSMRDLENYTPGDRPFTFAINGVLCGCLICLEWSFPELFQAYAGQGVDLLFHSAASVGKDGDRIFTHIVPPMMQGHAANHQLFISLANSCQRSQDFPSLWVRRSGRIGGQCSRHDAGMMVNAIADEPDKDAFYAMVRRFRASARDGSLYRDQLRPDPRSDDRLSL